MGIQLCLFARQTSAAALGLRWSPMAAIDAAEAWLQASLPGHKAALLQLSQACSALASTREATAALAQKLEDRKRAYGASLRDVKVVAARLVQEREAEIFALKRAAGALAEEK